jgi:CheY-like chemotaxis protein
VFAAFAVVATALCAVIRAPRTVGLRHPTLFWGNFHQLYFPADISEYNIARREIDAKTTSIKEKAMFSSDKRKRIVLVEDHELVRKGLERLLNAGDEFVVCEEAGDAKEGMEAVRETRPDAVIVDVGLPGESDGIELTKELRHEFPASLVLILSAHDEPDYTQRAADAGAMAYVSKKAAVESLRAALRNAFNGRRTFGSEVLAEVA